MIGKRIRHIGRYREVAGILARNGFGFILRDTGLSELLPFTRRFGNKNESGDLSPIGQRIRQVIEQLGPTFVKVGQIASTRPDMVPEGILSELEKLQDSVPPFSYDGVCKIVREEIGREVGEIFPRFDEIPIASASIGQVHRAVLKTGEIIAVKVQRPRIAAMIETDLEILMDFAGLAEQRLDWAKQYQVKELVEEFSQSLRAELDYTIEGRNAERIGRQFADNPKIRIPKIYWDFSTKKVLTMEYIQGIKLSERERLVESGCDLKEIAARIAEAVFRQMLVEGFFHGDPHPGNILVLPDQVITFLDFGMVGRLSPDMKYDVASLVIAMIRRDSHQMISVILEMGLVPGSVNLPLLYRDIEKLQDKYLDVPFSQVSLGRAVQELFSVANKHRIRIPADFTLLGKSLLTLEGTVERIAPDLSIIDIAQPFGYRLLKERYQFSSILKTFWEKVHEVGIVLSDLPKIIKDVLLTIKEGNARLEIGFSQLDLVLKKMDRISNQLSFSIVLLSFSILMTGMIIASAMENRVFAIWHFSAVHIGLFTAAFLFLWLLLSIFKSGLF